MKFDLINEEIVVYRYGEMNSSVYPYTESHKNIYYDHYVVKLPFLFLNILFITILISSTAFYQTDWVKWGKADYSYTLPAKNDHPDYTFNLNNPQKFILSSLGNAYWFFISDVDGDNCSFSPTCSHFFLESVKETNIFQGTLMFFDRFTRDMDIYDKEDHYPRVKDGHFYDPIFLYTLQKSKIKYIPPFVVVNSE